MTGDELLRAAKDLEEYLQSFDQLLGKVQNREHFRRFARGQLGPIERKSLEPIADAEGANPRTLQFFFSRYKWDHDGVRTTLQKKIAGRYGGTHGVFVIDETSDDKKGEKTAGVDRQYCGQSGKIDNCIVTVHVAYIRKDFHALIDGELFLPESWNPDPKDPEAKKRRESAGIPSTVVHESKARIALRQLKRAMENGISGSFAAADEGYGGKPWFRDEVANLGLVYVFEVPKSTEGWVHEPEPIQPEWKGNGRPPKPVYSQVGRDRVDELLVAQRGLRFGKWKQFKVHDGDKGPEVWEFKSCRFWEHGDGKPRGDVQWLLVGRNVLTKEVKYFLSNAPEDIRLEALIYVAFSRWRVERCFQDCKTELGLNHAELRTYDGISRHLILTAVNYYFLQDWTLSHRDAEKKVETLPSASVRTRYKKSSNAKSKGSIRDPK